MIGKTIEKASPWIGLLVLGIFLLLAASVVKTSIFGEVEGEKHIYFEVVFLILLAIAGELLVVYTKQPTVMILMVLGIFMSSSFISVSWGFLHSLNIPFSIPEKPPEIFRMEEMIYVFAQIGAVILLFKVGMHNRIEKIFSFDNLIVALAGVVLPFVVGYLYAMHTGGGFAYSMFMAAALTATSVGVTVAILKEFKLLEKRFAEIIIGAAVLDDILGLLVLSLVINVTGMTESASLIPSLVLTIVTAAVFLIGSVLAGNIFLRNLDKGDFSQNKFLLLLAFVMGYAYFAEFIKLSAIIGAFMAGIILSKSRHHDAIEDKLYGLEALFMPIFFISLGMLIDVNAISSFFMPILIISVLAIVTKVVGCGIAGVLAKLKPIEAAIVGFGMSQGGR